MDEPRAYYTERSKSEREKQCPMLTHIYGIWKDGTGVQAAVETQTQRADLWTQGWGEMGRKGWGRLREQQGTYITTCKTHSLWGFAV